MASVVKVWGMKINEEKNKSNTTSPNWDIQPADWRDYTQFHQLTKHCFDPKDLWPFWDLLGALTLPGMVRIKAMSDGRMVGFLGGEREPMKRRGWVTTLAVLPLYRRQGIARALLKAGERDLDMPVIRLSVRASNLAAVCLYESDGYLMVDRWRRYYAGGEDALVFEKRR
jgi:ribosomal protein S18 acetylase RimI-like enzyme